MNAYEHRLFSLKEKYKKTILKKKNVVGVGIGFKEKDKETTQEVCIIVLVEKKVPIRKLKTKDIIPSEIENIKTDVKEVGVIRALSDRTTMWRPAPGGVSIGHKNITCGTFGSLVRDRENKGLLILSNNHVLANCNEASIGDPILQPGPANILDDPNDIKYHIANLYRFVILVNTDDCVILSTFVTMMNAIGKILGSRRRLTIYNSKSSDYNEVDAAVAIPTKSTYVEKDVIGIGNLVDKGYKDAEIGDEVLMSGRTSGLVSGHVTGIGFTASVSYDSLGSITFENQIQTTPMAQPGDSGSILVYKKDKKATGLIFAGSVNVSFANPINRVLDLLNISI